jgi:hypothetical protein
MLVGPDKWKHGGGAVLDLRRRSAGAPKYLTSCAVAWRARTQDLGGAGKENLYLLQCGKAAVVR